MTSARRCPRLDRLEAKLAPAADDLAALERRIAALATRLGESLAPSS